MEEKSKIIKVKDNFKLPLKITGEPPKYLKVYYEDGDVYESFDNRSFNKIDLKFTDLYYYLYTRHSHNDGEKWVLYELNEVALDGIK